MGGNRADEVESVAALVAPGRPVAVVGEAGLGVTWMLAQVAARVGPPLVSTGGLRSLASVPFVVLSRAIGDDAGRRPDAVVARVAERVAEGVLVIDDLQWSDPSTLAVLRRVGAAVRVLAGIRLGDPGASAARLALAAAGGVQVRLAPLDDVACHELVRARRPDLTEEARAAVVAAAGGNPLALEQLVEWGHLAPSLEGALRQPIDELDPAPRRLLAALAARPTGVPVEADPASAVALEEAGLAEAVDGFLHPRHGTVAEGALDALDPDERRAVHRMLAGLEGPPAEQARHLSAAGDDDAARPLALRAAQHAEPRERAELLGLAARGATGREREDLLAQAVEAALDAWDRPLARSFADAIADDGAVASGRSCAVVAEACARDGDPDAAQHWAERVDPDDPAASRAAAASSLAWSWPTWAPEPATSSWGRACERGGTAPAAGAAVALVSGDADWVQCAADLPEELAPLASLWAGLASPADRPTGGPPVDVEALRAVEELHREGDADRTGQRLRRALEVAERPIDRELLAAHLVVAMADSGRSSAATELARTSLAEVTSAAGEAFLVWALVEAELAGGRLVRAVRAAERLHASPPSPPRCLAQLATAWAGALAPAASAEPPATDPSLTESPWPGLRAAAIEHRALTMRGGDPLSAVAAFDDAARAWAPVHRRGELRCAWASAEARRHSDPDGAIQALTAVEERASSLGHRPLVARARASLRAAGVRNRPSRGAGRGPLSAREVEVLELVRAGFTTGEAAQSLGVAASTVETQVESAMRKLDARTRVQAAARLSELGS